MALDTLNLNFNLTPQAIHFSNYFHQKILDNTYRTYEEFAFVFTQVFFKYFNLDRFLTTKHQLNEVLVRIFNPDLKVPSQQLIEEVSTFIRNADKLEQKKKVIIAFSVLVNCHQFVRQSERLPYNELFLRGIPESEVNELYSFIRNLLRRDNANSIDRVKVAIEFGMFSIPFEQLFRSPQLVFESANLKLNLKNGNDDGDDIDIVLMLFPDPLFEF